MMHARLQLDKNVVGGRYGETACLLFPGMERVFQLFNFVYNFMSRSYLSNCQAIGMVVFRLFVCPSVCPSVTDVP